MSTYTVEIRQTHPLLKDHFPYEVKVYGSDDMLIETDLASTLWGAKRTAKKMIKKIEGSEFKPKFITSYKVET